MPSWRHPDPERFASDVHDALEHLHNPGYLAIHPLARVLTPERVLSGEGVRRELLAAIEQLRPLDAPAGPGTDGRRYRYLVFRYVDGLSHDQAARDLGVSTRQASRDHQHAEAALVALLWQRCHAEPLGDDPRSPLDPDARVAGMAAAALDPGDEDDAADLAETLDGVLATLAGLGAPHQTAIRTTISDTLPPVAMSPTILRQAILNLLMWATEAARGGEIRVRAGDTARGVSLRIDLLDAASEEHRSAGSDLLRTARHLLEAKGVALEVSNSGSIADRTRLIQATLPPVALRKVLIVDDNPDFVTLFRRYLRGAPYRVIQATSATSALRLAAELRPDAIILDVMLPSQGGPVQDGWDLLRHFRAQPLLARTPVVVCSVLPEQALASSLGIAEFLVKPITRASLQAVLDRCCAPRPGEILPTTKEEHRDRPEPSA